MDVLSQVLSSVRVTSALFFAGEFTAPWAVASARAEAIAPLLQLGSGALAAYYLLTEGRAWVRIKGDASFALEPGDLLLVPRGEAHVLSSHAIDRGYAERSLDDALRAMSAGGPMIARGGGGGPVARFVCGYVACDQDAGQLLRSGLPSLIRIGLRSDTAGRWLEDSMHHLASDSCWLGRARSVLVTRMADTLLVETLRRYANQLPPEESSWLGGARDPVVGAALALFHRRPWHRWTVAGLAAEVAVSRSVLAERFTRCLGEPPLRYLGRWRLRLAARVLETTQTSILQLASDVGYTSEAAFNRAFKREFGLPPARYRRASRMRRDDQGPTSIREEALIAPAALRWTRKLQ
jgi:AraC-like DNA-binding protein